MPVFSFTGAVQTHTVAAGGYAVLVECIGAADSWIVAQFL